jgi:hypothetical protein
MWAALRRGRRREERCGLEGESCASYIGLRGEPRGCGEAVAWKLGGGGGINGGGVRWWREGKR